MVSLNFTAIPSESHREIYSSVRIAASVAISPDIA